MVHWPLVVVVSVFFIYWSFCNKGRNSTSYISQCWGLFDIHAFVKMYSLSKSIIPTCVKFDDDWWAGYIERKLPKIHETQKTGPAFVCQICYQWCCLASFSVVWHGTQVVTARDRQVLSILFTGFWPEGLLHHESQILASCTCLHIPNSCTTGIKCFGCCISSWKHGICVQVQTVIGAHWFVATALFLGCFPCNLTSYP